MGLKLEQSSLQKPENKTKMELYKKGALPCFYINISPIEKEHNKSNIVDDLRKQLPGAVISTIVDGVKVQHPSWVVGMALSNAERESKKSIDQAKILSEFLSDPKLNSITLSFRARSEPTIEAIANLCTMVGFKVKITSPETKGELQDIRDFTEQRGRDTEEQTGDLESAWIKNGWFNLKIEKLKKI